MHRNPQSKHTALLALLAVGMFGFAFALVPLYTVFCELTGLNGKTSGRAAAIETVVQQSDRVVTVQFLAKVGKGLPWEFRPSEPQLRVRLGETYTTTYFARNRASESVTGQAVPSVAPGVAALHLQKVECFCFRQQVLTANQDMEMPVQFYVDTELPEGIHNISLSYTMYPVAELETAELTQLRR
jgi:cytochrome c oxidase assembly protein subunit 11